MSDNYSRTSEELATLRTDAETLRDELRQLKESNNRLACLLSDQRDRLRSLLEKVKVEPPEEIVDTEPAMAPEELLKAA